MPRTRERKSRRSRRIIWGLPFWESPYISEGVIIVATQEPTGERPVNNVVDFGGFIAPSWPWHPDTVTGPSPSTRVTGGPGTRKQEMAGTGVPENRREQLLRMSPDKLREEIVRLDGRVRKLQSQRRVLRQQVTHYNRLHNEDIRLIQRYQELLAEETGRAESYNRELNALAGAFNAMSDTVHTTLADIQGIRNGDK